MNVYLPIAEIAIDPLLIVLLGGGVGILSGLFGVGGGFLATPILIFLGVPPAVAVATQTSQMVGLSVSGALAHLRRGQVDLPMGGVLTLGGLVGAVVGVLLFRWLRQAGQIDFVIGLGYVLFLGGVGGLMLVESARALVQGLRGLSPTPKVRTHTWAHRLPFKLRFRKSRLYVSSLLPLGVGFLVGLLAALLGIGGGFLMIPALIYLVRMPSNLVVGTSLVQIIVTAAAATLLQAISNHTVDLVLAGLLLVGGVVGVQIGVRAANRLPGSELRGLLALLVLALCGRMLLQLVVTPGEPFTLAPGG